MSGETATCNIPSSGEMLSFAPSLSPGWRFANLIMTTFFFLAALANLNDNDWYVWSPMYICPSVLCLVAFIQPTVISNHIWQSIMSIMFGVAIVMGVYQISRVFQISGKMGSNPLIHEEGREMGGLMIILAWTGISRFSPFSSAGSKKSPNNLMTGLLVVALTLAVVPLLTWSLCFVGDWHQKLGHCSGMFK